VNNAEVFDLYRKEYEGCSLVLAVLDMLEEDLK